jgi:Zn-dependent peptidase ImmA (M78 family)/transcriptional regulator with XRE-family HTH domain
MPSIPSNAIPAMLRWARRKEGLSIDDVATLENISPKKLEGWEEGKGSPTYPMLRRLAKRFHRPTSVFYLPEPPSDFGVVRDFRTLPSSVARSFSLQLRSAIRLAQERQSWASSYLEEEGSEISKLVGTYSADDDPEPIGRDLRDMLGATIPNVANCESDSAAFVYWRRLCEAAGIFVFQATRIDLEEMRGFSLPDPYAPAVVINSKEPFLPKIFTLIHEMAHILIGEASLSGAGSRAFIPLPRRKVERFCNQVASEVLVPRNDFIQRVPADWAQRESEVLHFLSRMYWVSRAVIALRLYETGFATQEYVNRRLRYKARKEEEKGRPPVPQARLAVSRVGESFSRTALAAFREDKIHGGQLSVLLNMRLRHLPQLEQIVLPGMVQPIKSAS